MSMWSAEIDIEDNMGNKEQFEKTNVAETMTQSSMIEAMPRLEAKIDKLLGQAWREDKTLRVFDRLIWRQ